MAKIPLPLVKDWEANQDVLSSSDMNTVFDAVKRLTREFPTDRGTASQFQSIGSKTIPHRGLVPAFIGVVFDSGFDANGAPMPDFTDCRYWVGSSKLLDAANLPEYPTVFRAEYGPDRNRTVVAATNIAEIGPNSHSLRRLELGQGYSDGTLTGTSPVDLDKLVDATTVLVYAENNPAGHTRYFFDKPPPQRYCRIDAYVNPPLVGVVGDGARWKYKGTELFIKTDRVVGSVAPVVVEGPYVGITPIYNLVEWYNAVTGIRGNSVDRGLPSYPGGFRLQPIRGAPVVPFWMVGGRLPLGVPPNNEVATPHIYLTQYENADDGLCT